MGRSFNSISTTGCKKKGQKRFWVKGNCFNAVLYHQKIVRNLCDVCNSGERLKAARCFPYAKAVGCFAPTSESRGERDTEGSEDTYCWCEHTH